MIYYKDYRRYASLCITFEKSLKRDSKKENDEIKNVT